MLARGRPGLGSPPGGRRPRVALVAHEVHDDGGMERALAELVRRGCTEVDFVVVSATLAPELRRLADWRHVPVPSRPFALKFLAFFLLAAARLPRRRVDLVHTMGAIIPRSVDVASVQFCHAAFRSAEGALAPREAPVLRRINTSLVRLLSLVAERRTYRPGAGRVLAAASRGVARELERNYPGVPVTVVPNGVDCDRFAPDADVRRRVRAAEAVPEDDIVALFVGGDWDRKGLRVVIEALAIAVKRVPTLRLWVVGRGDSERFRALAARLGVAHRVEFFGPRSDTERFYRAADVFVFPTRYEAFPLVALEAAAAGLPLVATPVNGVEELLEGGEAGIAVERLPAAVADALVQLATRPDERARMGHAARRRATAFTWEDSVRRTLGLYDRLLATARSVKETA
jgi:UDP-glucose:(heptosyl)LPS alpha-1,3-glucosyltransferase